MSASQSSRKGPSRVSRQVAGGVTVWVKDFDQASPAKWHGVQRALLLVTRLQLLAPVPSYDGIRGAEAEIGAIERFRDAGALAPEILWRRGATIGLSDLGQTLRDMQRRGGEPAIRKPALLAARELRRVHGHGLVHGRPILRNLTWDGKRIGFLDFEEQPLDVMPLASAQARDILLMLMSFGRRGDQSLMAALAAEWREGLPPAVARELRRVERAGRLLGGSMGKLLLRSGNRDLAGLVRSLAAIREALPRT